MVDLCPKCFKTISMEIKQLVAVVTDFWWVRMRARCRGEPAPKLTIPWEIADAKATAAKLADEDRAPEWDVP